jgi:triphosphoribosyl-dephospho-CoA synthase
MSRTRHGRAGMVAAAAQTACLMEVQAPKPGNVSRGRDLPGLTYRDFVLSAYAIGPAFAHAARNRVGRIVFEAVRATRRHVGTNTNLGSVLILAPLARAALMRGGPFRDRVRRVLAGLDVRDARDAYRAIRLAEAGGLGRVGRQDVRATPTVGLLECMRLAAGRDAIAREYATGFETSLGLGLPTLRRLRDRHVPLPEAIAQTYLTLLAAGPDTLVARRHGPDAARRVSRLAHRALLAGGFLTERGRAQVERLDRTLRAARPPLNPGATADLTVGALFVWLLDDLGWTGSIGAGPSPAVRPIRRRRRGSSPGRRRPTRSGPPGAPRREGAAPPSRPRRRRTRPGPRTTARRRGRRPPSTGR